MWLLYFLVVSYVLTCLGLSWVFPKVGIDSKKAWIPGVNFIEWCKIIGRPSSHALWLLFPIVNIFIFCGMAVDLVRSFGKMEFKDTALAVLYAPLSFMLLGKNEASKFVEPAWKNEHDYLLKMHTAREQKDKLKLDRLEANNPYKKSTIREWVESIFFAVFAAAFIRMFLLEAYVIPTPSMEGSLKVGDFLFVSKTSYGLRTPMTVIMLPLLHNRIPGINSESYISQPSLGYHRILKFGSVERYDPIVFNWPVGDSVYLTSERSWTYDQAQRNPQVAQQTRGSDLIIRPIDKKDHYIKRCVGMPGDSLQIINRQVMINGAAAQNPTSMQFLYVVNNPTGRMNLKKMDELGVNLNDGNPTNGLFFLNLQQVEKLKGMGLIVQIIDQKRNDVFPNDTMHYKHWTFDNYGPIYIPKKGTTTPLNPATYNLYRRLINVYEKNTLEVTGDTYYINGQPATSYTFKQDYYWAMGDNRDNSEDSRAWGFVPEDHIVGKPLFIWFSLKNGSMKEGINWNRIFTGANKM